MTLSSELRRGWSLFNVNYVLSKSMSDDDNERDSGGVQFENTFDLGPEWGPARLDRRHQFNGYAVFFLPYDVDVSTSFKFLSGLPIDAGMGRDDQGATVRDVLGTHRGCTEVATRELLDQEELPLGRDRVEPTLVGRVFEEQVAGDCTQAETA